MDKHIRRLGKSLGGQLVFQSLHHGVLVITGPFLAFLAYASEEITLPSAIIAGLFFFPALWFCTWNFVRVGVKRQHETFCAVWMKVLPQDKPAPAEGDNAPENPSLLAPVNALFRIQLHSLLLACVMAAVAAVPFVMLGVEPWAQLFAVPFLWFMIERHKLQKFLAEKVKADPALAGPVEEASLRKKKKTFRERLRSAWYFVKDFVFWTWFVAPVWAVLVMIVPGTFPRPLSAEVSAFFELPAHKPRDNGFYALAGLEAPLDSTDTIAFGMKRAGAGMSPDEVKGFDENNYLKGLADYKHFNICTGKKPPVISLSPLPPPPPPPPPLPGEKPVVMPMPSMDPNAPPPPGLLPVQGPPAPFVQPCLYLSEWGPILDANKKMLERYESLYAYEDFEAPLNPQSTFHGQLLMELARMESVAHAYRAYAGDPEAALQDWLRDARFLKKLLQTPATLTGFAIYKTCYNLVFRYLPYIISRRPDLAAKYKGDIESTMVFLDPGSYDYKQAWDRDAKLLPVVMMQEIDAKAWEDDGIIGVLTRALLSTMNIDLFKIRVYELTQRIHAALDLKDPAAMDAEFYRIARNYDWGEDVMFTRLSDMGSMFQSVGVAVLLGGVVKGTDLFDGNGLTINRERTRRAWLEGVAVGVTPQGMDEYLKKAAAKDARMKDVINGEAFYVDASTQAVCFTLRIKAAKDPIVEPRCLEPAKLIEREDQLKK